MNKILYIFNNFGEKKDYLKQKTRDIQVHAFCKLVNYTLKKNRPFYQKCVYCRNSIHILLYIVEELLQC